MPSAKFETAADDVKKLKAKPTDDELLKVGKQQYLLLTHHTANAYQLYGLYKQATLGDNDTAKPAIYDFKVTIHVFPNTSHAFVLNPSNRQNTNGKPGQTSKA